MPSERTVRHVYVHVPFCRRRCVYCNFSIAVRRSLPAGQFVDAVRRELVWHNASGHVDEQTVLDTLYFGGGTPSLLVDGMARIVDAVRDRCTFAPGLEVTAEANPEDIDERTAEMLVRIGVNRVSLGAQSFSDDALAWMHRSHDAAAIGAAVEHLRSVGIENVSLDLIFALPESVDRSWSQDVDRAIDLDPSHISLYGLTTEPRTAFGKRVARHEVRESTDDRYAVEYLQAHGRLTAAGYAFYEVSNAAKTGNESRHNGAYWTRHPYLGLGPSAHSLHDGNRWWNVRAWEDYRRQVMRADDPREGVETLDDRQLLVEELYLGLRTSRGISLHQCPSVLSDRWLEGGLARISAGQLTLTPRGWLVLDALVSDLTAASETA